jgi:hypothetical protein
VVFFIFHIGAFGGLTALNSYYDRDDGPVGGLWRPPTIPSHLIQFAWGVQLCGWLLLLPLDLRLAAIYGAIVLLALGYSHPHTRWKGHPWKSVLVVMVGQGALDFLAGYLTATTLYERPPGPAVMAGLIGAMLTTAGFYPLTQLYQLKDDQERGDHTLARVLYEYGSRNDPQCKEPQNIYSGRATVFLYSLIVVSTGSIFNVIALWSVSPYLDAVGCMLFGIGMLWAIHHWARLQNFTKADDFIAVHNVMRKASILFGGYVVARLCSGGI